MHKKRMIFIKITRYEFIGKDVINRRSGHKRREPILVETIIEIDDLEDVIDGKTSYFRNDRSRTADMDKRGDDPDYDPIDKDAVRDDERRKKGMGPITALTFEPGNAQSIFNIAIRDITVICRMSVEVATRATSTSDILEPDFFDVVIVAFLVIVIAVNGFVCYHKYARNRRFGVMEEERYLMWQEIKGIFLSFFIIACYPLHIHNIKQIR